MDEIRRRYAGEAAAGMVTHQIEFDQYELSFSEAFPESFEGILPRNEFNAVIRRVNDDIGGHIRTTQRNVRRRGYFMMGFCLIVVGVLGLPFYMAYVHKGRKKLKAYWKSVQRFLENTNHKRYQKSGVSWTLVQDLRRYADHDVVNPLHQYTINITYRPRSRPEASPSDERAPKEGVPSGNEIQIGGGLGSILDSGRRGGFDETIQSTGSYDAAEEGSAPGGEHGRLNETGGPSPPPSVPRDGAAVVAEIMRRIHERRLLQRNASSQLIRPNVRRPVSIGSGRHQKAASVEEAAKLERTMMRLTAPPHPGAGDEGSSSYEDISSVDPEEAE